MTFLSSFFSYVQNEEPKSEPESTAVATRNDAPEPEPAAESTPTEDEPAEEEEEEEPEDVRNLFATTLRLFIMNVVLSDIFARSDTPERFMGIHIDM